MDNIEEIYACVENAKRLIRAKGLLHQAELLVPLTRAITLYVKYLKKTHVPVGERDLVFISCVNLAIYSDNGMTLPINSLGSYNDLDFAKTETKICETFATEPLFDMNFIDMLVDNGRIGPILSVDADSYVLQMVALNVSYLKCALKYDKEDEKDGIVRVVMNLWDLAKQRDKTRFEQATSDTNWIAECIHEIRPCIADTVEHYKTT